MLLIEQIRQVKGALMIIQQPDGNYTFIKSTGPFSSGCRAQPGYEIVYATFHPLPPLEKGYDLIARHLQDLARPIQALCGMELRIPRPLSPQGFAEFNEPYGKRLADWNILVDGLNPTARTNVALTVHPVAEPSMYGFSYTVPTDHDRPTFVLSGAAEIRRSEKGSEIVSHGDVSTQGLSQKAQYILQTLESRLQELTVAWTDVTTVELYTVHNMHPLLETVLLPGVASGSQHGLRWHYARPPVTEVECEMGARGVYQECALPS